MPEKAKKVEADLSAEMDRFHRLIGQSRDLLTVVLRGHLLVEERLRKVIEAGVVDYGALSREWISYGQAQRLAQALVGVELPAAFWAAVGSLNKLRNTMSHQVEPTSLRQDLDRFVTHSRDAAGGLVEQFARTRNTLLIGDPTQEMRDVDAVAACCFTLWVLLHYQATTLAREMVIIQDLRRRAAAQVGLGPLLGGVPLEERKN